MTIDFAPPRGRAPAGSRGDRSPNVVIIGAGPAGLTAAAQLIQRDVCPIVLEADDTVGGISRTVERDGWRFDIGGHRFFTKVPEVEQFWHEILPADWAAQRIKSLSLGSAIVNALLPKRNQKEITSLIEEFHYPQLGPGMMW